MREFRLIKQEFSYLTTEYGFRIDFTQSRGSYCFIDWTNSKTNIKVMYDLTDENPISIITYAADSLGTIGDVTIYKDELIDQTLSSRERVHHAAEWLKRAIEKKSVLISD